MNEQSMGTAASYARQHRRTTRALTASLILAAGLAAGAVGWEVGRHNPTVAQRSSSIALPASGHNAVLATPLSAGAASAVAAASNPVAASPTTYTVYLAGSQAEADSVQATLTDPHAIAVADGTPDEMAEARSLIKQLQLEADGGALRVIDLRSR
ncbi:MAG TPA: hypothetical protein VKV26_22565 [Dehalococcoidia bacterium]|nr:hypothetical protein [Dehalococcoidia bacterium]